MTARTQPLLQRFFVATGYGTWPGEEADLAGSVQVGSQCDGNAYTLANSHYPVVRYEHCVALTEAFGQLCAELRCADEVAGALKASYVWRYEMARLMRESQQGPPSGGEGHRIERVRVHHGLDVLAPPHDLEVDWVLELASSRAFQHFAIK